MKKFILSLCSFLLLTGSIFAASFEKGSTAYVSKESVVLKSGTGFFAKKSGSLKYGDSVLVLENKGNKCKVQLSSDDSVKGWLNNDSLSNKKIIKADASISEVDELALAGKGDHAKDEIILGAEGANEGLVDGAIGAEAAVKEEAEKAKKNIEDAK